MHGHTIFVLTALVMSVAAAPVPVPGVILANIQPKTDQLLPRQDAVFDGGNQRRQDAVFDGGNQRRQDAVFDGGNQRRQDAVFDGGNQRRQDAVFDGGNQ